MKKLFLVLLSVCLASITWADNKPQMYYVDAHELRIINRTYQDTTNIYKRVPDALWSGVREEIRWGMGCSTGIAIRFRTNSRTIGARYHLRYDFAMSWMAYTGIKGTDLYIWDDLQPHTAPSWHYLGTGRPRRDSVQTITYATDLDGEMHEYLLNLPLYDGVTWFEVGVEEGSVIEYPQLEQPRTTGGRIVFWGTSVMQGGCCTRPGMTQTNILTRELGIECCNMGVSGEGKMWRENALLLAKADDVCCYVLDPLMNCTREMVDTMTLDFINILREAHPDVPIIMVEGLLFPDYKYDHTLCDSLPSKNASFYRHYKQLRKKDKNIYWLSSDSMTGVAGDATVDTWHLTDYGFRIYVDKIKPLLRKVL